MRKVVLICALLFATDFSRLHYVTELDQRIVVCQNGLVTPADDKKFNCEGLRQEALRDERRRKR